MPVRNLIHAPLDDNRKLMIGGQPRGSHVSDFHFFQLMLSHNTVSIGVSARQYRHLVDEKLAQHRAEYEGLWDEEADTNQKIIELMKDNLATFYLGEMIFDKLKRMGISSVADLIPAQQGVASIYQNNHSIILG